MKIEKIYVSTITPSYQFEEEQTDHLALFSRNSHKTVTPATKSIPSRTFQLVDHPPLPFTLQPNEETECTVHFCPPYDGLFSAILVVSPGPPFPRYLAYF
jgi:hypothetical protein